MCGNTTELGDAGGSPGKSSLFFLTNSYPGIRLTGDRVTRQQSTLRLEVSGALSTALENPRDKIVIRTPSYS